MTGLRFERRGEGDYYKVVLHIGSTYVPISDEDVEALQRSQQSSTHFLELFLDRIGYSSYLKEQIKAELLKLGTPAQQFEALRHSLHKLQS